MSIIYRVQQKLINNYVYLSKTNKLCKHKHNAKKRYPAGIYLFKIYNKNTRTRCEICLKKKQNLQLKNGNQGLHDSKNYTEANYLEITCSTLLNLVVAL